MTNLAFGGHFGFPSITYLAHVEEMEVLWIMKQEGFLNISRKFHLSLSFLGSPISYRIAHGLKELLGNVVLIILFKVEECNEPSCEALIFPYGVVLFNIFSTVCI